MHRPGHNDRLSSTFRLCSWGHGGIRVDRRTQFWADNFVGWPCWGKKNIFDRWKLLKAKIWATCLCVRAIWSSYILISLAFTYRFGNSLPCLICKYKICVLHTRQYQLSLHIVPSLIATLSQHPSTSARSKCLNKPSQKPSKRCVGTTSESNLCFRTKQIYLRHILTKKQPIPYKEGPQKNMSILPVVKAQHTQPPRPRWKSGTKKPFNFCTSKKNPQGVAFI